jgi:tryptophan synthase alpha chain
MNRIEKKFKQLKAARKKVFIAFLTSGDPDLQTTERLVLELEKNGVDIVELGVPFSDPLADGPTIQEASQRALKHHINLIQILNLVKRLRVRTQIPIALMTYYNPVFHYGEEKFIRDAAHAGVDGLIVPDLPPEEAHSLTRLARGKNVSMIFFISPTTTKARMQGIAKVSTGFIYYVSLIGVTGARQSLPLSVKNQVKQAKSFTKTPVCVGFGISTPKQVKEMSRISDGVIVGSAIVNELNRHAGKKDAVLKTAQFIRRLTRALK